MIAKWTGIFVALCALQGMKPASALDLSRAATLVSTLIEHNDDALFSLAAQAYGLGDIKRCLAEHGPDIARLLKAYGQDLTTCPGLMFGDVAESGQKVIAELKNVREQLSAVVDNISGNCTISQPLQGAKCLLAKLREAGPEVREEVYRVAVTLAGLGRSCVLYAPHTLKCMGQMTALYGGAIQEVIGLTVKCITNPGNQ